MRPEIRFRSELSSESGPHLKKPTQPLLRSLIELSVVGNLEAIALQVREDELTFAAAGDVVVDALDVERCRAAIGLHLEVNE